MPKKEEKVNSNKKNEEIIEECDNCNNSNKSSITDNNVINNDDSFREIGDDVNAKKNDVIETREENAKKEEEKVNSNKKNGEIIEECDNRNNSNKSNISNNTIINNGDVFGTRKKKEEEISILSLSVQNEQDQQEQNQQKNEGLPNFLPLKKQPRQKSLNNSNSSNEHIEEEVENKEEAIIKLQPLNLDFAERQKFIPSGDNNFKKQFINGLTKEDLIIFCTLIIITIIIAFKYLVSFYYENELEIMKNQIDREKKIFLFKKNEKDPFFKINKKGVFLTGAISLLITSIILYLTVKKRD